MVDFSKMQIQTEESKLRREYNEYVATFYNNPWNVPLGGKKKEPLSYGEWLFVHKGYAISKDEKTLPPNSSDKKEEKSILETSFQDWLDGKDINPEKAKIYGLTPEDIIAHRQKNPQEYLDLLLKDLKERAKKNVKNLPAVLQGLSNKNR